MKFCIALLSCAFVLAGCAGEIMKDYVGQDVTQVAIGYGPPVASFDLPDGRRAFQWKFSTGYLMPTNTTVTTYGNIANATTTGGGVVSQDCLYTLFGAKNSQNSYTITGFSPPPIMCQ